MPEMLDVSPVLTLSTTEDSAIEKTRTPLTFPPNHTLIFLDWDDTLLASSWVTSMGLRLDSPEEIPHDVRAQLQSLEVAVINLIQTASPMGQVCIVTNAETGWVELSCQRFIPRVYPLLSKVKVLSARSTFEGMFPNSPSDWKHKAFEQEVKRCYFDHKGKRNVVSLGDSLHEREAIHRVCKDVTDTRTKSVKFVERPTLEQLRRQLELVSSSFDYICNYDGDLDLMLTISLLF